MTGHVSVKEAVLPFNRFPGVDTLLGPEMRSTGEVMGIDTTFGLAFAKSQIAAGSRCRLTGPCSSRWRTGTSRPAWSRPVGSRRWDSRWRPRRERPPCSRPKAIPVATVVAKVGERPGVVDAVDLIARGKVQLVVNTPRGRGPRADGLHIRATALAHLVPCLTTVAAARAAGPASPTGPRHPLRSDHLQEYHRAMTGERLVDRDGMAHRRGMSVACCHRRGRRLVGPGRSLRAGQSGDDGVGDRRPRPTSSGPISPRRARRGGGQVAVASSRGPATRRPVCTRRRRG